MYNYGKDAINANIDNAYEKQTDKVKELLKSAKNRIEIEENTKIYKANVEKINKAYKARRISRKKEKERKLMKV